MDDFEVLIDLPEKGMLSTNKYKEKKLKVRSNVSQKVVTDLLIL